MRTLELKAVGLGACLLGAVACGGSKGSGAAPGGDVQSSGEAGARALLDADVAARRSQDLNKRYSLESPSYRAACSPDHFQIGAGSDWLGVEASGAHWEDIEVRDVKITMSGDTAIIAFIVAAKGRDLFALSEPDDPHPYKVVKEQGRWWKDDLRKDDFFGNPC